MFLHVSVILFTGLGLPHCMLGYTHPQDKRQAPPALGPEAGTPSTGTRVRHPPGLEAGTPPAKCMLGDGRYGQQAGGTHPTGMQSCFIL